MSVFASFMAGKDAAANPFQGYSGEFPTGSEALKSAGDATANTIISGLIDRGLPPQVAVGAAANMMAESGFDTGINEINPTVPGSRGGYGLNQWTGPRRKQYEAFAADRGASPDDLDTQLDFTVWELNNTERAAGSRLAGTTNPLDAARVYSESFLRPGVPHMDNRLKYAAQFSQYMQPDRTMSYTGDPRALALFLPQRGNMQPNPAYEYLLGGN